MAEQIQLNAIQKALLAHIASGHNVYEAAELEHVSFSWAHKSVKAAKKALGAPNIPSCVMRAHAVGILSHPTGESLAVFVEEQEMAIAV